MKVLLLLCLIISAALAMQEASDPLEAARAESNPEKRYALALDVAGEEIGKARQEYEKSLMDKFRNSLIVIEKSVILSDESLQSTGKDPAKSPKHFKRAEKAIRNIVKRLSGLEDSVGLNDRALVAQTREKLQKIQERLVMEIVGGRR